MLCGREDGEFNKFIPTLGLPWWLSGKESPATQEIQVQFLGQEDPLEEGVATHSSILARKKSHGLRRLAGDSP